MTERCRARRAPVAGKARPAEDRLMRARNLLLSVSWSHRAGSRFMRILAAAPAPRICALFVVLALAACARSTGEAQLAPASAPIEPR